MVKVIKARYQDGKIEPLEPLELEEGAEVLITIADPSSSATGTNPTTATSGAWKDSVDCEALERDIYANRLLQTRPEVIL